MKRKLLISGIIVVIISALLAVFCFGTNCAKKYTVSFDSNGGTAIESQQVQAGKTATEPEIPQKEHYTFAGWYLDEVLYSFNEEVKSDITLKAKWNKAIYNIVYDTDGGVAVESDTAEYGTNLIDFTTVTTTQVGYDFLKWQLQVGETLVDVSNDTIVEGDVTLKAIWQPLNTTYIVKHLKQNLANDHYIEVLADRETLSGLSGSSPTVNKKDYIGFAEGFYTETTIAGDGSTIIEVKYDRLTYTVTWYGEDGSIIETDTNVKYGDTPSYDGEEPTPINPPTGNKEYIFSWTPEIVQVTGNAEYTATFTEVIKKYTVSFYIDGDNVCDATQLVEHGSLIDFSKITITVVNKVIDYWNDENQEAFDITTPITEDVNLYAVLVDSQYKFYADNSGSLSIDKTFVHESEDYSYKFVSNAWDLKFTLTNNLGLTNSAVKIYIYTDYNGEDVEALRLFSGSGVSYLNDINISIKPNIWNEVELESVLFNNLVQGGWLLQLRMDFGSLNGANVWISICPDTTFDDIYTSNTTYSKDTSVVYGDEEYSYTAGLSGADCRIYFNNQTKRLLPSDATSISFYIKHNNSDDINFQFIKNDTWEVKDIATLKVDVWTKVVFSRQEFINMCDDSSNYFVRAQNWDSSVQYWISGLYFDNTWFNADYSSAQVVTDETINVYAGDSRAWKVERVSDEPCWIALQPSIMSNLPEGATEIYFYVKATKSDIPVQFINDNSTAEGEPWSIDLVSTVENEWVKVSISRAQFEKMCSNPEKYRIRVNQWAADIYYISELHFA